MAKKATKSPKAPKKSPSSGASVAGGSRAIALPFGLEGNVSKEDVISIKIAQFEQGALKQKRELEGQIKGHEKGREEATKEAVKLAQEAAEEAYGSSARTATEALSSLAGDPLVYKIATTLSARDLDDDEGDEDEEREEATATESDNVIHVRVIIRPSSDRSYDRVSDLGMTMRMPESVKAKLREAEEHVKAIREKSATIVDLYASLQKIDVIERACRAEIAKEKLRGEGHEALIEKILSVETGLLLLPGPTE